MRLPPLYPMDITKVPAAVTTKVADGMECSLYWLAVRVAAISRAFTSYRIAYREEILTSDLHVPVSKRLEAIE